MIPPFRLTASVFLAAALSLPAADFEVSSPVLSSSPSFQISTFAGASSPPASQAPTATRLGSMDGVATSPTGAVYVADSTGHRVWLLSSNGTFTVVAGDGSPGLAGDAGPANSARLNSPYGLAADFAGNLYVADFGNARIRRISTDGRIDTIAGGGALTAIPATGIGPLQVKLSGPRNLAFDYAGNLYFTDAPANRLYRLSAAGQLTLLAGESTSIPLSFPAGVAADYLGNLYVADTGTGSILMLQGGVPRALAMQPALDGPPLDLAADPYGRLTILTPDGGLYARSLVGQLTPVLSSNGFTSLRALHQGASGQLYFAEPKRLWSLSSLGSLTLLAEASGKDTASEGGAPQPSSAQPRILAPMGVALDAASNLYIADEQALRLWRVTPAGVLESAAGNGQAPSSAAASGDGGAAASALLFDPVAVAISPTGEIAIAEYSAHRVRVILPSGIIYTAAGTGAPGVAGVDGPAQLAQLNQPRGLAYDASGNLFIADSGNGLIRRLGRNGFLTRVGQPGLNNPTSLAFDSAGVLHVAESGAHSIRRLSANGAWEIVAGTGSEGAAGEDVTARLAQFRFPTALAFDASGGLLLADAYNHRIRRIAPSGLVSTIAGTGAAGLSGDGGGATQAQLHTPAALALHADGRIFAADLDNHRIRLLTPSVVAPPGITDPAPGGALRPLAVLHAATAKPGPFAPGQLVSLYAGEIPASPEVIVNGEPSALFYTSSRQINFQLPYLATPQAVVELRANGATLGRTTVALAGAAPGLFSSEGAVLAVSPTGELLSPGPGIPRGSVVTLYATGSGAWDVARVAGAPPAAPLGAPLAPVTLRIGNSPADILYAGEAPGLAGVLQLNVRVPGIFTAPGKHEAVLGVGAAASPEGFTLQLN